MKTIIFTSALFVAALFAVYSCEDNTPIMKQDGKQLNSANRIEDHWTPIDTASVNIQRYVDSCYSYCTKAGIENPNDSIIRSYTISDIDLLSVLGLPISDQTICTYKKCRVYFGLNGSNQFKLYFTPVDSSGNDVILSNPNIGPYVLDLNAPCPSTCGNNAKLNPAPNK